MKKTMLFMMTAILAITLGACRRDEADIERVRIDDADAVFLDDGETRITRGDVFNRLIAIDTQRLNSEGVNFLLDMIDETLLADRMAAIEPDRIEEERLLLRYGTTDSDEIDTIESNPVQAKHALENFTMTLLRYGVDPTDETSVETFIRLNLARRDVAYDYMVDHTDANDFSAALRQHYQKANRGDITAISLVYPTAKAALEAFHAHDLVFLYDGGIGWYFGEEPIETLRLGDFNDSNTERLTEDEVFEYFVTLYNDRYPYREALDSSMTLDTAALDAPHFHFDYRVFAKEANNALLANILFDELSVDGPRYTIEPRRVHRSDERLSRYRVLYFIVDQAPLTPFEALDDEAYDALVNEYIESQYSAALEIEAMMHKRHDHGLVMHDAFLHRAYRDIADFVTQGQADVVASFEARDGFDVATVDAQTLDTDAYFAFLLERLGGQVVVEMAKEAWLHQSDYFTLLYGEPRDIRDNDHAHILGLFEEIESLREEQGDDFDYFIVSEFGRTDDIDLLLYVLLWDVANHTIPDNLDLEKALDYAATRRDDYFRLDVEHLLIYVDFDENFAPDDYTAFLDGLSPEAKAAHDALIDAFVLDIRALHEDGAPFAAIAKTYLEASHDDETWGQYKQAGLILRHENLSPTNPMRAENLRQYVAPFRNRLYDIYEAYTTEHEDDERVLDPFLETDGPVVTQFGQHIILTERPENDFFPPSARYEGETGDNEDWLNDEDLPTAAQLSLWLEHKFISIFLNDDPDFDVPEDLDDALTFYFDSYLGRFFPSIQNDMDPFNRRLTIERFWSEDVVFSDQNDVLQTRLDVLYDQYVSMLE